MSVNPTLSTYKTGEKAPVTGIYETVGHIDGSPCRGTAEERTIPLNRGGEFPPHKSESKGVLWRFLRAR